MSITRYQVNKTTFEVDSRCYKLLHAIGSGAYGTVVSAFDVRKEPNVKVAIKKVTNVFVEVETRRIVREVQLLSHFDHENIIGIRDILKPPSKAEFRDLYIVTDLMDTDLHQIIRSEQVLTDQHIQYFMYQILRGLKCIHSANVLHRDLKPNNILLNANCDLKICDFGLARDANEGMTAYVATRWYRAPELLVQCKNYDKSIDIWSVGCIFCELLSRRPIFPGSDYINQLKLICSIIGTPTSEDLFFCSDNARKYMLNLPLQHPKSFQALYPSANPLAIDLISKILQFNFTKRPNVDDCLAHPYFAPIRDPSDEPTAPIFDNRSERNARTRNDMKILLYNEMLRFHPEAALEQQGQSFDPLPQGQDDMQNDEMEEETLSDQSPHSPDADDASD